MAGNLRIGTSGWNYPTGRGTWNGVFYPASRQRPKDFDELRFYAEHFDTVEVNSTFYGQPRPDVSRRWVERTPATFEFSIKLYQKFTHPRMYRERVSRWLTPDVTLDSAEDIIEALTAPTNVDLDEFRRGIEPLAANGSIPDRNSSRSTWLGRTTASSRPSSESPFSGRPRDSVFLNISGCVNFWYSFTENSKPAGVRSAQFRDTPGRG